MEVTELVEAINKMSRAIDFVGWMILVLAIVGGATTKVYTNKGQ